MTTALSNNSRPNVVRAISRHLDDAGISRREAARRTGIAPSTLARRLDGSTPFLINELEALVSLFDGVAVSDLFGEVESVQ